MVGKEICPCHSFGSQTLDFSFAHSISVLLQVHLLFVMSHLLQTRWRRRPRTWGAKIITGADVTSKQGSKSTSSSKKKRVIPNGTMLYLDSQVCKHFQGTKKWQGFCRNPAKDYWGDCASRSPPNE